MKQILRLLVLLGLMRPVHASTPLATAPPAATPSLAMALNPDGTLRPGVNGSFDARQFCMSTAPDGHPVFRPAKATGAGDERWADGFGVAGTNGRVVTIVRSGTNVYIGGTFRSVYNVAANNIAKWNGTTWSPMGAGMGPFPFEGTVSALAIASNGDVYAGGLFSTAGGVPANNVAKWNGTAWSPLGAGIGGSGNNRGVSALAIAGNGDVYVGGNFGTAGGSAANNVARWNGTAWSALGAGMSGPNPNDTYVGSLAVASSGDVYAGGAFATAGGVLVNGVARWNGTAWNSLGSGVSGRTGTVGPLAIASNGDVYVGGAFSQAGGVPANGVAKWNGTAWSGLGTGPGTGDAFVAGCLELASNGDVYAGGRFVTSTNATISGGVVKWNGANWTTLGTGMSGVYAGDAFISDLALAGNGDVYVSGNFTHMEGAPANNLARWNGTAWSSLGTGAANGIVGSVNVVAVASTGEVYAGGSFFTAGGVPATNVAKWNGTAWSSLGTGAANGVNNTVKALAVLGSDVYVGGIFDAAGGVPANSVAKWNGTAWSPLGAGVYQFGSGNRGIVSALAVAGNGDVYAGGSFVMAGGVSAGNVAKWNGMAWSSLGTGTANGVNGNVNALAVASTGEVYVAGLFSTAGGAPASRVAKWDGATWSPLGSGVSSTGRVDALAIASNGDLYAGGLFTQAGSVAANGVARWNGTTWSSLGAGLPLANGSFVVGLAVLSPNEIYVGIDFVPPGSNIFMASGLSKWDGASWTAVGTGLDYYMSSLSVGPANKLYVGGNFAATGDGSKFMVGFGIYDPAAPLATWAAKAAPTAQLFPNPAHGTATLRLPADAPRLPLTLLDAQGRTVRRYPAPAAAEAALDLRGLPAGAYLVRCGNYAQRLVVE